MDISEALSPIEVTLDQLLLDPNNPRFAELGDSYYIVPESRIPEKGVQRDAFDKMKKDRFDVVELRDTIKTIGYLPVDRVILREWDGPTISGKKLFVVIEGNRRIAALKWLLELHETGRETLSENQLSNFTHIPALILNEDLVPESTRLVLPGLRHVSGIKEWGPYQKAKAVYELRKSGQPPREVAQSLGLSTQAANQLWRSYLALEQMGNDDEFGELVKPSMYSYFEEIMKRPNVRGWLDWNDDTGAFMDETRRKELYSWIAGESVDDYSDIRGERKLPEAKSIRKLSEIIDDPVAMARFRSTDGTLENALVTHEREQNQNWKEAIITAEAMLSSLTPDTLRSMSELDLELIQKLSQRIEIVVADKSRLAQY